MKKMLVALAALAVVAVAAPSAHAEGRPHVSKREWNQAQSGMSMAKVHRLFGTRGRLVDSWPEEHWQARTYRPWRSDIYLLADFVREHGAWRLDSKSIDRDCGRCFRSQDVSRHGNRGRTRCVTNQEYRVARGAWQMEGLTKHGVRFHFGFDGSLVTETDNVLKRRYRDCRNGYVIVRYRHFPQAPGPSSRWWVVSMRRTI